jgi:hypothetical protein
VELALSAVSHMANRKNRKEILAGRRLFVSVTPGVIIGGKVGLIQSFAPAL